MYALPPGPTPAPQRQTLVGMSLAAMSMVMLVGTVALVLIALRVVDPRRFLEIES